MRFINRAVVYRVFCEQQPGYISVWKLKAYKPNFSRNSFATSYPLYSIGIT